MTDVSELTITGTDGDDVLTLDLAGDLAIPVTFDGGMGTDTLVGPAADVTWDVTGPDAGTVAGVGFASVENLTGAPDNADTFVLGPGGFVGGLIDGGDLGFDSLSVSGSTVVSNPTDAHSGTIVVDGHSIAYTGLEPVHMTAPTVIINGADAAFLLKKDLLKIHPDGSGGIEVLDRDPTDTTNAYLIAETQTFTISGVTDVTINGGEGVDTVEFDGDYNLPGTNLTVNAETIKVDPGVTVNVGTGTINFNAAARDNGFSVLGITTTIPVLGNDGAVDISSSQLMGGTVNLTAFAGTLTAKVQGSGQTLTSGGELVVDSVEGFDDSGSFTIDVGGTPADCTYSGRNHDDHKFTGLGGCSGAPLDGALVRKDITENGSGTGINHAGLDLEYHASVNIHGTSVITASGDVTISSTVDVTATANAAAGSDKGNWAASTAYTKGDVVKGSDTKRYAATKDIASGDDPDPVSNHGLLDPWSEAKDHDSSVAATFVLATGKSQLSDTSSVSAAGHDVKITSSVRTKVTSNADSSAAGLGAGIAVAVFVTNSQAFIDSNAATPVLAKSLTITADTENTSPTTAKASPKGAQGNDTDANSPTQEATTTVDGAGQNLSGGSLTVASTGGFAASGSFTGDGISGTCAYASITSTTFTGITVCTGTPADGTTIKGTSAQASGAAGKADDKSKTSDGSQPNSAALAVLVLVSTTHAYVSPTDASSVHLISTAGGDDKIHAGSKQSAAVNADAGNVKFSPDAPTFAAAATTGGFLLGGKTYYYRVSATFSAGESLPGPEGKHGVPSGTNTNRITLNWGAIVGATGYKIYRSTDTGKEQLLATVGAVTTYTDSTNATPSGAMPTDDTNSGWAIAIAVNVSVVNTKAWLANNVRFAATSVTVEALAPGTDGSSFAAHSISGAGGSSVGVAGSIAVTIVDSDTIAQVQGTDPVDLDGANLALTATSKLDNSATADAKQASDGSTTGIGASFALSVVNDTTDAGLPNGSQLDGAKDLTQTATSTDGTTTTANGGASTGSGSLALSAQAAITISNVTTIASVGTGADLTLTGALNATATQTASTTTKANGSTKGGNAGIGLSLALDVVNHDVESQAKRNIDAAGAVSFSATGSSPNDSEAQASSAGAKEKTDANGDGSTKPSVKDKSDANLDVAKANDSSSKTSSTTTPEAKSGESGGTKVTVAAAVAITIATLTILAGVLANLTIVSGAGVTLTSRANGNSKVISNGKATKAVTANIGAAVSINKVTLVNRAQVGLNTIIKSHGLSLTAGMQTNGNDKSHDLDTEATSGAGEGKVGIAGSLALTIADLTTSALVLSNAGRGPPSDPPGNQLNGGDLSLTAESTVSSTAKAMAKDTDSGTVGIGAGVAINIVNDTATASIDSGAAFDTDVAKRPANVSLTATDADTMVTHAEAGTDGKAGSDLALTPDVAISYPTVLTSATIGGNASQSLSASGSVSLTATQDARTTTSADASAGGADVSIGLALALVIADDEVTATVSRNLTAGGAVGLQANGSSDNESTSTASAKGAKTKTDDTSGKDVNGKADDHLTNANTERHDETGKDASTSSTPKAATGDKGSGGSSTSVQVAAAVTINIVTTKSLAQLVGGITVGSGGVVNAKTQAATIADAIAKGESVGNGSSDGVGVGVSINLVDITNLATTGTATITGTGLDVEATMNDKNNGRIRRWDDTSKQWVLVDRGETLPITPSSGDYYQLAKAQAPSALVDGAGQDVGAAPHELKLKSVAGFPTTGGTFTGQGISGTCTYTGVSGSKLTGIGGCTGTPDDKATVTLTTTTTVSGASQDVGTTHQLTVASVAKFASANGAFTVKGLSGTCSYTGTSGSMFTGISGCTGTPDDGAAVMLVRAPGVYKWSGSDWVLDTTGAGDHGVELPFTSGSHTDGTLFRLAEHEIVAVANAGAGKTDVGIAGAVAINIITHDHTDAIVGAGSHVTASTDDVTIKAQSSELDLAKANSEAEDAKSVGVGAAVALSVLSGTETRAEAENTAVISGGKNVDVEALSRRQTETEVDMGASGDDVTVAPGVALVVLDGEDTIARLGTAATGLTATGTITVKAVHEGEFSAEAKSVAAGSTAVGVSIALNIVLNWNTLAEVDRDVEGTKVEISAESATNTQAHADATTKGADKNDDGGSGGKKTSDERAQGQITDNPNTTGNSNTSSLPTAGDSNTGTGKGNSTTESQGGDKNSGGVGVAASVSLNWVVTTNKAKIGDGAHVTATDEEVKLSAENSTQAAAKSTGLSASADGTHIAAAVAVDFDNITNDAQVGQGAVVTGNGITIEAVNTGAKKNQLIAWGLAGSGGSSEDNGGASVAASIGVEVILFHTEASVAAGAHLISTADVEIHAENAIGIQNMALSGAASAGGAGVGGAIVVNVFPDITTEAIVYSGTGPSDTTQIDATGKVEVSAKSAITEADPIVVPVIGALPKFSSVALAAAASSGGAAVSGSVIVNVFTITTKALIAGGTKINQFSGAGGGAAQSLKVEATDDTHLTNIAGGLNFSSDSSGVGIGIDVDVIIKHVSATIEPNTTITTGGAIDVNAASTENFHELAVDVGGSSSGAAVDGSVIVVVLSPSSTAASVSGTVHAGGTFTVSASDDVTDFLLAGGAAVSTSSAGVAVSVIVIDRQGTVDAGIGDNADLRAGGTGLHVTATQHESMTLISVGGAGGDSAGVAGSVIVNIQNDTTLAHIGDNVTVGSPSTGVEVAATDTTDDLSLAGTIGIGGTAGVGVGVVVDVFTKDTEASIGKGGSITASGNVTVSATSSETFTELSVGGGFGGTASVNVQAAVPVISITTKAYVADGSSSSEGASITAGGSVGVMADESMTLNVVAGNISGGGTAAVGAAVSVPVVTKETHAWIGNYAHVNATGNTAITVPTGTYNVHTVDMRFDPTTALNLNTITFTAADDPGYRNGEEVFYDNGGGTSISGLCATTDKTASSPTCGVAHVSGNQTLTDLNTTLAVDDTSGFNSSGSFTVEGISGICRYSGTDLTHFQNVTCRGMVDNNALVGGGLYYVGSAGSHKYQLYDNPNLDGSPIAISGGSGENHRLVPTDQAGVSRDASNRFNPTAGGDVDYSGDWITVPYDLVKKDMSDTTVPLETGDSVVYSSGGGTPIGGLVDGGQYYAIVDGGDPHKIRLAANSCDAKGVNYGPDGICDNQADGSDDGKDANGNPVAGTVKWIDLTTGATGRSHSIVPHGTTPSGDSSATGPRTITENTDSFRGVAVTANNTDNVGAFGISLGFAGTAAVNLAGVVNVENIHTSAHIGNAAHVNCGDPTCSTNVTSPNGGQSVRVAAGNQYYELEIAASLAIGGEAGVAVPITVRVVNIDTYAYVGNGAQVRAANDISITANGRESIIGVTAGAGGGTVGVAGTVSVTVAHVHTYACTGTPTSPAYECATGGATLVADGNVIVAANDDSHLVLVTVAVAGGLVGVGLAVGVASLTKETEAYLGAGSFVVAKAQGGTLDFVPDGNFDSGTQKYETHNAPQFRGLVVLASSSEDVFGLAPAVAGGFVGVAGGVGVTVMYITTMAFIGQGSKINCQDSTCAATATGSNGAQSVSVSAVDYFKSLTIAGGVAGGFVGVAGGVDIGVADTSAQAFIGKGSYVRALGDVEINGLSRKQTQTFALSAAGGFVGVAVAVSVWSVGTQTNSTYHDGDGPFRGPWDGPTANSSDPSVYYKEGDVVTFGVDNTRYVAKVDHPLNDPTDTTEWDGPTDALHTTSGDQQDTKPSIDGADQAASGSSDSTTTDWSSVGSYSANDEVNFNGHVYKAKNNVLGSAGDPQTDTADWAQEVGGYGSALSGTTSSAPAPTWMMGTPYKQGDKVSFTYNVNGSPTTSTYTARNNIAQVNDDPRANTAEWANADSQDATNTRLANAFGASGGPQDGLDAAAMSVGGDVTKNAIAHVPSGGTTATIDSSSADPTTIVAGGHLNVIANDVLDVFGIAGAAAGGFVGVGASVLILNVKSVTDAGVANYASISAGGGVNVTASMDEHSTPIGFAGGGGFVGVGAQVAIVNDTSTQNAHIDDHAAIQKAGGAGLKVTVDSQRDVHAYAIGVAVGAGAIGAAVAVVNVDGDATAKIGDVAVGNPGPVNAINVSATDHVTSDTLVISVAGGIFVGVGAAVAVIGLDGTLKASSGAHGSVGGGGFSVTADGTHNASLTSVNVATGAGAVGVTVDKIENSRSTEAEVTSAGAINFTTPGAAKVQATASNTVKTVAPGGAVGIVGVAATISIADLSGHTTTTVNGSITNATTILISSIADNKVTSFTLVIGISIVGISGALSSATIDDGANIQTTVGSTATLNGSGTIIVEAKTRNDGNVAQGTALGGTAGALAAGTFFVSIAEVNGNVEANMNGHITGGSSVDVNANATNDAEAHTLAGSISLGGALAGSVSYAGITSKAHVTASGASGASISGVSGTSTIESTANNTASSTAEVGSAGLIFGAAVSVPTASIGAPTNATWDGAVADGSGFTVQTEATNNATVSTTPISAGLFALAAAVAYAEVTPTAQATASVGADAVISAPGVSTSVKAKQTDEVIATTGNPEITISIAFSLGVLKADGYDRGGSHASFDGELTDASSLTVQTDTSRTVTVTLFSLAFSVGVSIAASSASATIGDDPASVDEAHLGSDTNIHSGGTAITVKATRGASASATANGGAGGILAGGVAMEATSSAGGTLRAYVDGGATVGTSSGKPGSLSLTATDTSTSASTAIVGAGALGFAAAGSVTDATANPTIEAYVGSNVHVVLADGLGHDVTVTAISSDAEADATSKSFGGGAVHVGGPEASATSSPVVHAYIGTGSTIVAGGGVTIDAESNATASGTPPDDYIKGLSANGGPSPDNSITFPTHGLATGDVVLYSSGGTVIGGLRDNHQYAVIVVDKDTLRMGATFSGAVVNADSLSGGITGIDPNRAMVRFASPHHLENGDTVIYRTTGTSISSDFGNGAQLFVRVIDAYTVELYTTYAAATSPILNFGTGSVSGNLISTSSFSGGARVTYRTAAPLTFRASGVDVDTSGASIDGDNANAYNIFLGHVDVYQGPTLGHGLTNGQLVIYEASDPSKHIGNLTSGFTYYVHVVDAWTIQLANTYCEAVGWSLLANPGCVDATPQHNHINVTPIHITRPADNSVVHAIRPAPLGDLVDGYTYEVRNAGGGQIALRTVGGGTDLSLATTHIFGDYYGNQQLFLAGSALHASTDGQQVYLQLTGTLASPTSEKLLAGDGSSIRAAAPPSGDGKTSSSARGGGGGLGDFSFPGATTTISPTAKAYLAATTVTIGGDLTITSLLNTNVTSSTENGSGGAIAVADVESDIIGTDNNTAFIGKDFGSGITQDKATPQVDATGITVNAGGNIRIAATTFLQSSISSSTDGGGAFDASHANSTTNLTNNTATVIGKNATVTGSTVAAIATSGGSHKGDAHAFAVAFIGGAFATADLELTSRDTSIFDGDASTNAKITALHGVDLRALHENLHYSFGASGICICIGPSSSSNPTNATLTDTASGHRGVTVYTSPRIVFGPGGTTNDPALATPLDTSTGDVALALYVQAEQPDTDAHTRNRTIHWSSDVVIYSGPDPYLLVGPGGDVVTSVNIRVNGVDNPAPGDALGAHPYIEVEDLRNHMTGDIWMQSAGGTIDGGAYVGGHYWGTFTFRDNWHTVTILNESDRQLVIDDIDVINRTANPVVTEYTSPHNDGHAKFAIVRQVDPSLVTITNSHTSGPDLLINGTILNPIGETDITSLHGAITSSSVRGGLSSFDGIHHSLIVSNILHLYAGTNIGAANDCVNQETPCGSNTSLCLDAANPCLNVDLVVWAGHPQHFTTWSGTSQYVDLLTRLRDSTKTDPADPGAPYVPLVTVDLMVALYSIFVLLRPTVYQSVTPLVPGVHVNNVTGDGPTGDYVSFYYDDGDYSFYPLSDYPDPPGCPTQPFGCPTPLRELGAFASDVGHEVESTYDFTLLDAGEVGSHSVPLGDVTVDAANTSPSATHINIVGYVDIHQDGDLHSHTNGFIQYTEKPRPGGPNHGDLRVAEIESTASDVTLRAPGAILDADNDAAADVIARNITLIAGDNVQDGLAGISGHGGVGTPRNFLEIIVNGIGGALGVLNVTDTASERHGWNIDSLPVADPGASTGTYGVFITQTNQDLEIDRVLTNGDASLVALNGSIHDGRNSGDGLNSSTDLPNVEANNIDLGAYCDPTTPNAECGNVGDRAPPSNPDALTNDLKIDSGHGDTQHPSTLVVDANGLTSIIGRVGIETQNDIYLTETSGALNVLVAQSLQGNVRLSVREHAGQGDDLNLLLPYGSPSGPAYLSDTIKPAQNDWAILIDYLGVANVKRDIIVVEPGDRRDDRLAVDQRGERLDPAPGRRQRDPRRADHGELPGREPLELVQRAHRRRAHRPEHEGRRRRLGRHPRRLQHLHADRGRWRPGRHGSWHRDAPPRHDHAGSTHDRMSRRDQPGP